MKKNRGKKNCYRIVTSYKKALKWDLSRDLKINKKRGSYSLTAMRRPGQERGGNEIHLRGNHAFKKNLPLLQLWKKGTVPPAAVLTRLDLKKKREESQTSVQNKKKRLKIGSPGKSGKKKCWG